MLASFKVGLSKLRKNARESNVKIKTKHGLIEEFNYPKKYSAIISTATLQFIKRKNIKKNNQKNQRKHS
ncbi:MAG: hypothetical protein M1594_02795 [Candidatus Marsarchaeota archaeon]|nr:hypothetical protein [Candidatus Marsarchaeota archaeon]